MQPKLEELLAHFHPRDAEPAGGFGLVALRQSNGLFGQFGFHVRRASGAAENFVAQALSAGLNGVQRAALVSPDAARQPLGIE
jgi:hypothetical protein